MLVCGLSELESAPAFSLTDSETDRVSSRRGFRGKRVHMLCYTHRQVQSQLNRFFEPSCDRTQGSLFGSRRGSAGMLQV